MHGSHGDDMKKQLAIFSAANCKLHDRANGIPMLEVTIIVSRRAIMCEHQFLFLFVSCLNHIL